ncbi:hypothetical protein NQ314_017616 [Rhamnusium bicolor]|uniref:Uncharacterized protein n=1 Tax=Rhamnusium bicolor TaxID=1586634 RepID=A0AAV8WTR4_9CUCU|nr:hypothetical protein NQ314_017616 [Rhamnusium bicolor]
MACCSEDPSINKEVQNDSEVEAILSRDCDEILPDLKEKPMSPILSTSIINRKHIMGSRSKRKKIIPEFFEDTFTLSQNECLINRIEKLEEIESYRQNIYKIMVTKDTNSDFCFKKPISPVPNKGKKNKVTPCENSLDIVESENNIEPPLEVSKNKQIDLVKCSGFQTATGKTIPVSETDIKKHSRLFEDIINPSQNCYTDRNKKYAFLSKSKSTICIKQDNFNAVKSVLSENDISLTQEIYESGISNTQMLCAVNDVLSSVDNNKNNEVSSDKCDADFKGFDKKDATESHEFFQRLISIFQSLKDFTNKQMHKNHNRKSIFSINDTLGQEEVFKKNELNYRKHVITDLPLPPKKRIRSCSRFECIANEDMNGAQIVQNKEIDALLTKKSDFGGFSSASGKSIKISENSMNKARNLKKNIQQAGNEAKLDDIKIADSKLLKNNSVEGFSCAVENIMKVQNTPLKRVKNIFDDFDLKFPDTNQPLLNFDVSTTCGFQTAGGSKLRISEIAIRKAERDFNNISNNIGTRSERNRGSNTYKKHKRRLGVSFCKQIQIPDSKLNRAKLLFEEDFYGNSSVRPRSSTTYTSTPVRQNSCSTPIRNDLLQSSKSFSDFMDVGTITPIKINVIEAKKGDFSLTPDSKITLSSPTKGNAFDWINDLEVERRKLEDRLKIVVERQKALENRSEEKLGDYKRPRKGILYQSKITNTRISLNFLVKNQKRGEADTKYDLFHINPQNAENVHFKEHHSSTVTTRDGAIVIPNSKDIIGLSEIENAFNLMPGVESRLIPNGWLRNHYKWIIWKLASYERMFPIQLGGCLCVENVVQQLKYRYDREIDRAERSALRKIYEKDDAPQKRMILCVSDIKKVNWRNKKAEEMRAQEWDNERYKKLEQIQENVSKNLDYFQDKQNINLGKEYKNISEITCSKTLYEVKKNSKDPDCIQNNLSIKKQEEMAAKVNEDVQRLSSPREILLLVNIYEGPSTCLLLDNLKRGQATTVCNLTYLGLKDDVVQALANHFTIFSSYSQHRHLQEGLDSLKKRIAEEYGEIL